MALERCADVSMNTNARTHTHTHIAVGGREASSPGQFRFHIPQTHTHDGGVLWHGRLWRGRRLCILLNLEVLYVACAEDDEAEYGASMMDDGWMGGWV